MIRARVGVVGATGLVGSEMLRLLEERGFPVEELRVFASPRSEGRALTVRRWRGASARCCATAASTGSISW